MPSRDLCRSVRALLIGLLCALLLPVTMAAGPVVMHGQLVVLQPLDSARITVLVLRHRGRNVADQDFRSDRDEPSFDLESGDASAHFDGHDKEFRFAGRALQQASFRELHKGVFHLPLNRSVQHALATGRELLVLIEGREAGAPGQRARRVLLAADLHAFDPARDVVRVDLYSTLLSVYRRHHPELAYDAARRKVDHALGAPASTVDACSSTVSATYFDPQSYLDRAAGRAPDPRWFGLAIALLNRELVQAIDAGESLGLGNGQPPGGESSLASALATTLLENAFAEVEGEAIGFALTTIFGAPDKTPEELAQIETQLTNISQQLTQISAQIDALSAQLVEAEAAIIGEIDLQAYQARAASLQAGINTLCSLQGQLVILADSSPTDPNNATFISTLAANIQTQVDPILRNIQTQLLGSPGVEGLIDFWARLNASGSGYPLLFSNLYLRPAVLNLDYYVSAQVVALNLLSEFGHYTGGSLGQNFVNDALRRYFPSVDQQNIQLAARKRLPDGTYPALVLASDDVTIDSRNAVMWQRTYFCGPPYAYQPPDPDAAAKLRAGQGQSCGYAITSDFVPFLAPALAQFNQAGLSGLTGWRMPHVVEATTLYSARGSLEPWAYLHNMGIYTMTDDVPDPLTNIKTSASNFTSDTCGFGLPCIYNLRSAYTGDSVFCGNLQDPPCGSIVSSTPIDINFAIAVRNLTAKETYHSVCDANGQNCSIPCGPADDPTAKMCPLP